MITIDIDFDAIRDKFVSVVSDFMDVGLDVLDDLEKAWDNVDEPAPEVFTFQFDPKDVKAGFEPWLRN